MSSRRYQLHIDELVLDGFDNVDQQQLGTAVQNELQRLFIEQGVPSGLKNNMSLGDMSGEKISLARSSNPDSLGIQAAGRIYQGLDNLTTNNSGFTRNKD